MPFARMNTFQRLTLQWDGLHPYNAAQVMRLDGRRPAERISQAWSDTLLALGLGAVERRRHHYRHLPAARPILHLPEDANLDAFVSTQMNLPFNLDDEGPFRAFALAGDDSTTLGIIYHHWIADSVSIRTLMREWFCRLHQKPCRQSPVPIIQPARELPSLLRLPSALRTFAHWRKSARQVRRLAPAAMEDLAVAHRMVELPHQTASLLRSAARQRQVKVTDLLLCSIGLVAHRHLPATQSWRPDLALGNIRDVRSSLTLPDPDAFGATLAFSTLLCPADTLADREALLRHIAAENDRQRAACSGNGRGRDLHLAIAAGQLLPRQRLLEFYRRRVALSAGLSNVDLTNSFAGKHPEILAFHRVSPTGPSMPLAITPTTLRDQFNISFTWRQNTFTQTTIAAFIQDLTTDLRYWLATSAQSALFEPAA